MGRKFIVFVIFIAAVVLLVKNIYKLYGTEGEIVEEKTEVVDTLHLRFKNVPIDGTLKDFVKRMEEAGFKKDDFSNYDATIVTTATLEGDFAGYKDWFLQQYQRPGYTIEAGIGQNPLPISQFDEIYNANLGILVLGMVL